MSAERDRWGVVLADFRPAVLHPFLPQRLLLDYTADAMTIARCGREGLTSDVARSAVREEIKKAVERFGVPPNIIAQRQTCCIDPSVVIDGGTRYPEPVSGLFKNLRERPSGPSLDERLKSFRGLAETFLEKHYAIPESPPGDLIHVSTTGYLLPSPVQRMAAARKWNSTTVTHSYHMGCYGAFPAVRTAVGLLATGHLSPTPKTRIDLIHTEMVSLHIDLNQATPGNIVTSTLFGDGFITYSAYSESEARAKGIHGLKVLAAHEQILPGSAEDMTLEPGPQQFDMHLSMRVPIRIRDGILPFVKELCRKAELDFERDRERIELAIHPGGTKILEVVADSLGVNGQRMAVSAGVLRDHGNMASATIPHVWHRIMQDDSIPVGKPIVTAAFGPGLTVTGLVLEKT